MASHLLNLYTYSRPPQVKRLTAYFPDSVRRYSQAIKAENSGHQMEERAPSTLEEFEKVAEKFEKFKEEKARQGLVSQTADKTLDALEEAIIEEEPKVETVKEAYKEPVGMGNFRRRGD